MWMETCSLRDIKILFILLQTGVEILARSQNLIRFIWWKWTLIWILHLSPGDKCAKRSVGTRINIKNQDSYQHAAHLSG